MAIHNIMSCQGWTDGGVGWFNFGSCMKAKLGLVILFFLLAVLNKWLFGMMGVVFNLWVAAGGGIISYLIVVTLTGSFKAALLVGIVVGLLLGYFGGGTLGDTAGGDD
jgi:hypothetical protein